jgi:hypothetical protein
MHHWAKENRNGVGTHFQWDKVNIQYNVLYAVGYVNGKAVAKDTIVLLHLPQSPNFNKLYSNAINITKPQPGYTYAYRVNCGGPDYKDENSNTWFADKTVADSLKDPWEDNVYYHSVSWPGSFPGIPSFFASQRRTFSPIKRTRDWKLFQTFRYGKNKLQYEFGLPDGEYLVELYFIEPWLGIGGGINAKAMRLFDVAINDKIILKDLDIWSEAGTNIVLKKVMKAKITGGKMTISFPETKVGQAVISAIAIASKSINREATLGNIDRPVYDFETRSWMDIGDKQYDKENILINTLPPDLFGANWIYFKNRKVVSAIGINPKEETNVYIAVKNETNFKDVLKDFENTQTKIITDENEGTEYIVFRKRLQKGESLKLNIDGRVIIAYQSVSKMQPAYDLKPITQYKNRRGEIERWGSEGFS